MVTSLPPNRQPWRHLQLAYVTTVKALERTLAPHGMRVPGAQALLAIAGGPEPVTPSHLALALALETSSVTGLVDRLVERGWVTRRRDLPDRREVRLHLTSAGQAAVQAASEPSDATLTQLFAGFSPTELAEFTHLLGRVSEHAQGLAGPEPDRPRRRAAAVVARPDDLLVADRVSTLVNDTRNDSPQLILPLDD